MRVVALAGGIGGAKLAHGLALAAVTASPPHELTVVVNTADDLELHGLHVSPDLDTVMYTLAGVADRERGWGLAQETWQASEMLAAYGAETWFRLGDRDLATHLVRSERLGRGERLTVVTAALASALGVGTRLLPMSDQPVRTKVGTDAGWFDFQEWFVRRGQRDEVRELRIEGLADARPTPEVLAAVRSADAIVLAPSNPFLSIGPILGLPGMADAVREAGAPVVAVSPIVGGTALKGPADRMLRSLGGEASAAGIARHYAQRHPGILDGLVIDDADAAQASDIEALGLRLLVTGTVMRDDADRERLARETLEFAVGLRPR
ncbi:MAG TPA: 2-phospho-L-lactate transferase [Candidatus Limnocylindrales bacterium]|nr:2-phospho-L-lactate transferase [Candidatus Limnocylindrales bacterium]